MGGGVFQLTAAAAGYITGQFMANVAAPNDGTPDTVLHDFVLVAGQQPTGDSLIVNGTVTNADTDPIVGATVTVSIITMTGTQTATGTTGADGRYTVAMVNTNMGRNVTIAVTADGYVGEQAQAQVGNASDGTTDVITRDFQLDAIVYDTLVVTGRVIDSVANTGLVGASVVISSGGMGGTVLGTVTTGANGNFSAILQVQQVPANILWEALMDGYVTKSGQTAVANDTAAIGTVALATYATTDSVTYTVSGRISDSSTTLGIRNAEVVVLVVFGTDTVLLDTVVTNMRGEYTAESGLVPYRAGDNTVTVSVSAAAYAPVTRTITVATSTTEIVVDFALQPPSAVVRSAAVTRVASARAAAYYSLSGRRIGAAAGRATQGVQLVLRRVDGTVAAKVIPAR